MPQNRNSADSDLMKRRYRDFVEWHIARRPFRGRWRELPLFLAGAILQRPQLDLRVAWRNFFNTRAEMRNWRSFARSAIPLMACPLMGNTVLNKPGGEGSAALVVSSFETEAQGSSQYLLGLARRMLWPEGNGFSDDDIAFLDDLWTDQEYQIGRRRRIPFAISHPFQAYAFDLWIPRLPLKNGVIDTPLLPCMAEPGLSGRINLMPWWIATGDDPPADLPIGSPQTQREIGTSIFPATAN